MTRPKSASAAFVAMLPDTVLARFEPVLSPLVEIVNLMPPLAMGPQDSAVFSSANGVRAAPDGQGRTAYCIGPATTRVARSKGWVAKQAGEDAQSLVATLQNIRPDNRLFHLSGEYTRGDIAPRLSRAGLTITRVVLYEQRLRALTDAAVQKIRDAPHVMVPLFSPRTAAQFAKVVPKPDVVHAIALSAAVADELADVPLASVTVAARPDAQAMGEALANLDPWK